MAFTAKVKLGLPKANELIHNLGLDPGGDVQHFQTQNVLRRIQKYMPFLSGAFIKTTISNTTETEIVSTGPQAAYLFYGKVMVDSETGKGPANIPDVGPRFRKGSTLVATDRDLNFNKEKNPMAGPRWDLALEANEKDALVKDLQNYTKHRASGGTK